MSDKFNFCQNLKYLFNFNPATSSSSTNFEFIIKSVQIIHFQHYDDSNRFDAVAEHQVIDVPEFSNILSPFKPSEESKRSKSW